MFQKSFPLTDKTCFLYGNPQPSHLLIQPVGAQDLSGGLEKEVACLKKMAGEDFLLAAFEIRNWNQELSPWEIPPVWGTEAFGNGAAETLDFILRDLLPELKRRFSLSSELPVILGGYSLAGLFSLWAAYQADVFSGIAAVSPSVWFTGWMEYALSHPIKTSRIYLSLGDKEERTKNQTSENCRRHIRKFYQRYSAPTSVLSCTEELHSSMCRRNSLPPRHFLLSPASNGILADTSPAPGRTDRAGVCMEYIIAIRPFSQNRTDKLSLRSKSFHTATGSPSPQESFSFII